MKFQLCFFVIYCVLFSHSIKTLKNVKKYSVKCEEFLSCTTCVENECGWCYITGKCSKGNEIGLSKGYCPYKFYETTSCKVVQCDLFPNEESCNKESNRCSWCKGKNKCLNSLDIHYTVCDEQDENKIHRVDKNIDFWVKSDIESLKKIYSNNYLYNSVRNPSGIFPYMLNGTEKGIDDNKTKSYIYNISSSDHSNTIIQAKENALSELKRMFIFKDIKDTQYSISLNTEEMDDISLEHFLIYKKIAGHSWSEYLLSLFPHNKTKEEINHNILQLFFPSNNMTIKQEKKEEILNEIQKVKTSTIVQEFNPEYNHKNYTIGSEIELYSYVNSTFMIIEPTDEISITQQRKTSFILNSKRPYYVFEFPLYNNLSDIIYRKDIIHNGNNIINLHKGKFTMISKKMKINIKNENCNKTDKLLLGYTIKYKDTEKKNDYNLFTISMNNKIVNSMNTIMKKKEESISSFEFIEIEKGDYQFELVGMDIFDRKEIPKILRENINNKEKEDIYQGGNDISDLIRFKEIENKTIDDDDDGENSNIKKYKPYEIKHKKYTVLSGDDVEGESIKEMITKTIINKKKKAINISTSNKTQIIDSSNNEIKETELKNEKSIMQDAQISKDKGQQNQTQFEYNQEINNVKKQEEPSLSSLESKAKVLLKDTINNSIKESKNPLERNPSIKYFLFHLPSSSNILTKKIKISPFNYYTSLDKEITLLSISFSVSSPKAVIIKANTILTLQSITSFTLHLYENKKELPSPRQEPNQLIIYRNTTVKKIKAGTYTYELKYTSDEEGIVNMIRNKWDIISLDILILDL